MLTGSRERSACSATIGNCGVAVREKVSVRTMQATCAMAGLVTGGGSAAARVGASCKVVGDD